MSPDRDRTLHSRTTGTARKSRKSAVRSPRRPSTCGGSGSRREPEASARQPFAEVWQVTAPPDGEARAEQSHAEEDTQGHAQPGSDQIPLEGPAQEEAGGEQDGDDADPGGPARADALLEIERAR